VREGVCSVEVVVPLDDLEDLRIEWVADGLQTLAMLKLVSFDGSRNADGSPVVGKGVCAGARRHLVICLGKLDMVSAKYNR
jgi:hypothetical protein